jgi:hypothetical protein
MTYADGSSSRFVASRGHSPRSQGSQTPLAILEQFGEPIARHGLAQDETLCLIAAHFPERAELFFGFDALCDNTHAKSVREGDDRRNECFAKAIIWQAVNKGAIDLQRVDRQVGQAAQGGVAGTEVVDGDANSVGAQPRQSLHFRGTVIQQRGLGDLDVESAGRVRPRRGHSQEVFSEVRATKLKGFAPQC